MLLKCFEHHRNDLKSLVISPPFLFTASSDGSILKYSLSPFTLRKVMYNHSKGIMAFCMLGGEGKDERLAASSIDSKLFLISEQGVLSEVDLRNGEYIASITRINGYLWCGTNAGNVIAFRISPTNDLMMIGSERCHERDITCLLSNDVLFSASSDNTVKVWNPRFPLKVVRTLTSRFRTGILKMLLLNDTLLITGDYEILMYRISDFSPRGSLSGHDGYISTLASLGNGRVISGSHDHSIKIWNLSTRICERTLTHKKLNSWISCLCSHKNHIFSGSNDGNLRLWKVQESESKTKKKRKKKKSSERVAPQRRRIPFGRVTGNRLMKKVQRVVSQEVPTKTKTKRKRDHLSSLILDEEKKKSSKIRKVD